MNKQELQVARKNEGVEMELAALTTSKFPQTAAQGKVEAIANLTMKAYERAGMLQFTAEEIALLEEDFPDTAFRLGAGGDDRLIYIEHAYLRERLNKIFKAGQWAIIPRNRWAENFTTEKGVDACRVYVEAMLVVRGAFVAEAVGDMVYYLNNQKTNYGDAVEGAKSACLRRCAKELGIGLQAWKKDFCEGWKVRQNKIQAQIPAVSQPDRRPAPPTPTPIVAAPAAGDSTRSKMINALLASGVEAKTIQEYAVKAGIILPNESAETDWPLQYVTKTKGQYKQLAILIKDFANGNPAVKPASN